MFAIDKYKLWIFWIFRILFIAEGIYALFLNDWLVAFLSVLALALSIAPSIVERELRIVYPAWGEVAILLFIAAAIYLGGVVDFYNKYWWWDSMLHALSGFIIADIAFLLVYAWNRYKAINLKPIFVAVFSFCFAVTLGVLWEIFEFAVDSFFATNLQENGIVDTMWDLILDSSGALIVSMIGFIYLKSSDHAKAFFHRFRGWKKGARLW